MGGANWSVLLVPELKDLNRVESRYLVNCRVWTVSDMYIYHFCSPSVRQFFFQLESISIHNFSIVDCINFLAVVAESP